MLREKNIILTEQRYAWEENVDYLSGEDPIKTLTISMKNVKRALDRWNERVRFMRGGGIFVF